MQRCPAGRVYAGLGSNKRLLQRQSELVRAFSRMYVIASYQVARTKWHVQMARAVHVYSQAHAR